MLPAQYCILQKISADLSPSPPVLTVISQTPFGRRRIVYKEVLRNSGSESGTECSAPATARFAAAPDSSPRHRPWRCPACPPPAGKRCLKEVAPRSPCAQRKALPGLPWCDSAVQALANKWTGAGRRARGPRGAPGPLTALGGGASAAPLTRPPWRGRRLVRARSQAGLLPGVKLSRLTAPRCRRGGRELGLRRSGAASSNALV